MNKKEKRRIFVATIEGHEAVRHMPVVIRYLMADSLRQVVDKLIENGDLRSDFLGPNGKFGRDGRLVKDEEIITYARDRNDYGTDILTIDEFTVVDAERAQAGGGGVR
ncbi:MAG: hypothetical protein ABSG21_17515 [Spirochaetia bacterium]|jgi:hypothetical protein